MSGNFSIVLASYAAVVATTTAIIQIMNFRRDRPKVKISTKRGIDTYKTDDDEIMGGETYTVVIVANAGRRPITITEVGGRRLFPKIGFVDLVCHPKTPIELTEGKQLSALVDDEQIELSEIEAWEVHDAIGNAYRLNVAGWVTRTLSRIRKTRARLKSRGRIS